MAKVIVNYKPDWVKAKIYTQNFIKIFDFFVIKTPCNCSSNSIEWQYTENEMRKQDFKDFIKKTLDSFEISTVKTIESFSSEIAKTNFDDKHFKMSKNNKCIFYKHTKYLNDFLFYIRCSIAHGRFAVKKIEENNDYIYLLESIKKIKDEYALYLRCSIKESTLLRLMEILLDRKKYENYLILLNEEIQKYIIDQIKNSKTKTKKAIITNSVYQKSKMLFIWDKLKKNNKILYNQNKMIWEIL